MQKWEYLFVALARSGGILAGIVSRENKFIVNGKEREDWRNRSLTDVLNHLGEEGWELVQMVSGIDLLGPYIMKRPKL